MLIKDEPLTISPSSARCPLCGNAFLVAMRRQWWKRWLGARRRLCCQGCGTRLKKGRRLGC